MINEITGFHIEATNLCTLKCSGCARTRFIEQWPQHWKNHSLDVDVLMKFLDIDIFGKSLNFCGTYGDPIYHPRFHDLILACKLRGARVTITTNGSYRDIEWWDQLCKILTEDDIVTFSIDGTPENFTLYRENANWKSIKSGIDICSKSKARVVWKYIPFLYNQDDIQTTRQLSQDLGVDEFVISPSDRFDEKTQYLIPTIDFVGERYQSQECVKNGKSTEVDPKCQNGREHFIAATGHYVPCCFLVDHRFYYKNLFGKEKNKFDIRNTTLTKVLSEPKVIEFYDLISKSPNLGCQYNCPKVS